MIASCRGHARVVAWIGALLIVLSVLARPSQATQFAGGVGTPQDPYKIATAEQLIVIGSDPNLLDRSFILISDIDLTGITFAGAAIPSFEGCLDGGNRVIRNLTVRGGNRVGLVGELRDWACIRNLAIEDVNVAGGSSVAGMVGRNFGKINNCRCTGVITGSMGFVGGLVGENEGGYITNCCTDCVVTSGSSAGGLLGYNYGRVVNCYATGTVTGKGDVGGLLGNNLRGLINCCSDATVTGEMNAGGLVGSSWGGDLTNCFSSGAVICPVQPIVLPPGTSGSGQGTGIGGLMGAGYATMANCFWDVNTSGQSTSAGGPLVLGPPESSDVDASVKPRGLTTARMTDVATYLAAGWDFLGETANGLSETWQMPDGGGYPVLSLFHGYVPQRLRGRGVAGDPYLVSTAGELAAVCYDPWACYKLVASVDLRDTTWSVGVVPLFGAMFDGGGNVIRNLTIKSVAPAGLFRELAEDSLVCNLGVEDANVVGPLHWVGMGGWGTLAGSSTGLVMNCYSTGIVRSVKYVGGLVGRADAVLNCYSTATVIGDDYVGGLAGWANLMYCYSTGPVTGTGDDVYGLSGSGGGVKSFYDIDTSGQTHNVWTYGLSTSAMVDVNTYLAAGWDFRGESTNGLAETWQMPEGGGYPVLSVFNHYRQPTAGGQGASDDPFLLATAVQLAAMCYDPGACYRLVSPVDLSGMRWSIPVVPFFYGSLDGGGRTIRGVTIRGYDTLGLFGMLAGQSRITDLHLTDVNVVGENAVGGLAGRTSGSTIVNCSIGGKVSGGQMHTGGLVGLSSGGRMVGCVSAVAVTGEDMSVGGLAGETWFGQITRCRASGPVTGNYSAGGLVGENDDAHISGCSTSGVVTGGHFVGGLVGLHSGRMVASFSTGAVTATGTAGGLAGSGGPIVACYSTGAVTGVCAGGLVGDGGKASLVHCYSVGPVHGDWAGGLAGSGDDGCRIDDCFWDVERSGVSVSYGGMGLTTRQMKDAREYSLNGWAGDPNWIIDNGNDYPRLGWEGTPGLAIPEPIIDWLEGRGTEDEPYVIATNDQLVRLGFASVLWDSHFVLTADLDLAGTSFSCIGLCPGTGFTGDFNGNGHVIRNLRLDVRLMRADSLGLFGYIGRGGSVRDLGVENVTIAGGYRSQRLGGLVGWIENGMVVHCHTTGTVSGGGRSLSMGGLAGSVVDAVIDSCWSGNDVYGGSESEGLGGLAGTNTGDIRRCYAAGRVSGEYSTMFLGGLVGSNGRGITDCYATGDVGEYDSICVGGLVGSNWGGAIVADSYSAGRIQGRYDDWGLVGDNYKSSVLECFWDMDTSWRNLSDGGTGLATEEMQTAAPYLGAGWDFETVWTICEGKGYPRLRWEGVACDK